MIKTDLRRIRRARDLTMQELARMSGVSLATINNIESGRASNITASTAIKLVNALNCSLDLLFCR